MKKALLVLLLLLLVAAIYFFRPVAALHSFTSTVPCNADGVMRQLVDAKKWVTWWPGIRLDANTYRFNEVTYRIDKILLNGFEATLFKRDDSLKAMLEAAPVNLDSTQFLWKVSPVRSSNFFKTPYLRWKFSSMESNVTDLAAALARYFSDERHVYGMRIVKQKVTESSMISLKQSFTHYPTTAEVYRLIDSVKLYIQTEGGIEVNPPMLNIYEDEPSRFEVMVAIPTQRDLTGNDGFQLKKMVLGNILVGEVRGGISNVRAGEQQLANYVLDHRKTAPAIPYQSLVTDRIKELDSTKWITRLYYPVYY